MSETGRPSRAPGPEGEQGSKSGGHDEAKQSVTQIAEREVGKVRGHRKGSGRSIGGSGHGDGKGG
jgi:hypothetical protein